MRLFVALRLEPALLEALLRFQSPLRELDRGRRVRWVEAQGMHLTLKFLGEVEEARRAEIEAGLEAALGGRPAPTLALGSPGGFPDLRRPRVLWVGLAEEGSRLGDLHQAVEEATTRLGWEPEKRAFQPHLTLGRVKEERGGGASFLPPALLQALRQTAIEGPPLGPQGRVSLMRSHLSPQGARYEELRTWALAATATN